MVARTNGCRSRTWGREAVEDDEEACGKVGWPGGGQSAVVDGSRLVEEEAVRVELYSVMWPVAQARRCCYTFNGRRQCGSLARAAMEVDSGGTRRRAERRA
jgi:hypothetical protein